ncbi:MAG: hypothetical protein ACYTG2_00040 [Planctomycetota bacterium]|jgi:hypothetical protein
MTDHDTHDDAMRDDQWNGSRVDSIIARIVDREAVSEDWDALTQIVRAEPGTVGDLLDALRLDAALRADVDAQLLLAERVDLPQAGSGGMARVDRLPRGRGWARWTGWAAAGVLAVCWLGTGLWEAAPTPSMDEVAQLDSPAGDASGVSPAGLAPDDATVLDGPRLRFPDAAPTGVSLASDQVMSELPMHVVETRPAADGQGYEVYYVRRQLQRARVGSVYSLGLDEQGQPAPVPVDPALYASADSL